MLRPNTALRSSLLMYLQGFIAGYNNCSELWTPWWTGETILCAFCYPLCGIMTLLLSWGLVALTFSEH